LRTAAASGGGGAIGSGCGSGVVGCGGCRIVSNGDDSSFRFVRWLVSGLIWAGWCWFIMREKYYWLADLG